VVGRVEDGWVWLMRWRAACNRLDRLTSGLMFIAKTKEAAESFMKQLQSRTIRKQYVARVKGEFPE
jgi:tRNA pseudouridine32 synthase